MNLKNKLKVDLKLVGLHVFKFIFSLNKKNVLIYDMKIIIYFSEPSIFIFSLLNPTLHILETKSPHSKVKIKSYLYFKKLT
jgi:hypothetical protein